MEISGSNVAGGRLAALEDRGAACAS